MYGRLVLIARIVVRSLARRRSEAALLLVAVAVSSATLTLGLLLHGTTADPYRQTRIATAGPDVVASVFALPTARVTPSQMEALASLTLAPGVTARTGPYPVTWTTLRRDGGIFGAELQGRDSAQASVDQPKVLQGHWVMSGGAVVERGFAEALGVHVGDRISLGDKAFDVVGIAVTAAFSPYPQLCIDGCALTTPQLRDTNPGLIWLTRADTMSQATDGQSLAYFASMKLAQPSHAEAFAARHSPDSMTAPSLITWQQISAEDAKLVRNERTVMLVGSWLLATLAVASVTVLVGSRLAETDRRVGLLKALGCSPSLIASTFLAEFLALSMIAVAIGILASRPFAGLLTRPGAGLLGTAGAVSLTAADVGVVSGVGLGVTALATVVPAVRASRSGTMAVLADSARSPRRVGAVVSLSRRMPVCLLLGVRLAARRPRRTLLAAAAVAVAVAGVVLIQFAHASLTVHEHGSSKLADPRDQRLNELMLVLSVLLAVTALVNLMFITAATALDSRAALAVIRALGASPGATTASVAIAQVLPTTAGALVGLPLGAALFASLSHGTIAVPAWWQIACVVPATMAVAFVLTAIPARIGAMRPVAAVLQAEHA